MEPLNKRRPPGAALFAALDDVATMGKRPAARRGFHSPPAAGALWAGLKGACGVAAHCAAPATPLRHAFPPRRPDTHGLPGLVHRFLKNPVHPVKSGEL